ncbi:MAG: hypothetical protein OES32_10940 [Acidobacteriota bacterium]|nr:hypothetical protein [Acidobacteriota bacterium]MDH3524092.1 hypothetical protein [Acidobacteriota bacterium]
MPLPHLRTVATVVAFLAVSPLAAQPEACRLGLAAPDFEAPAADDLHALPHGPATGHSAFHGQGLYGLDHLYLVHLPVFMGAPAAHPHNFQVILEVDLDGEEAQARYRAERGADPMSLYTATPLDFDQTALATDYPGRPALDALPASEIVKGHFEQGGVSIVSDVRFDIRRVVYFREFFLGGSKLGEQSYLLFGRGGEAFGAHLLSAPPDFDQILAVEVEVTEPAGGDAAAAVAEALAGGIYLQLPERPNQEATRLRDGSELSCSMSLPSIPESIVVTVRAGAEIYCEAGEFSQLVTGRFNDPRRCSA